MKSAHPDALAIAGRSSQVAPDASDPPWIRFAFGVTCHVNPDVRILWSLAHRVGGIECGPDRLAFVVAAAPDWRMCGVDPGAAAGCVDVARPRARPSRMRRSTDMKTSPSQRRPSHLVGGFRRVHLGEHHVSVAQFSVRQKKNSPSEIMTITIETAVNAPVETAWDVWTSPDFITRWNFASDDWACPSAKIDLQPGGKFSYRMEAKDGSVGFDFEGEFTSVSPNHRIEYSLGDDRKVTIEFRSEEGKTRVIETFDAEDAHSGEQQRQGWQSILNNYKKLVDRL
jgi:uncharacterized protein YndB with AHSA1/START domain